MGGGLRGGGHASVREDAYGSKEKRSACKDHLKTKRRGKEGSPGGKRENVKEKTQRKRKNMQR